MALGVVAASAEHLDAWAELRADLWPGKTVAEHRAEAAAMLASEERAFVALLDGRVVGFAEAALRRDYVNGCETSPVIFLEGIYVRPAVRRSGVAKALTDAVAAWGRAEGCTEFASDAEIDNTDSRAFHLGAGFEETERVVYFRKRI